MKTRVLPHLVLLCAVLVGVTSCQLQTLQPQAKLTRLDDRVQVDIGGEHFTDYVFGDNASRSYCYPLLAADGTQLARDFPQKKDNSDDTDHPWHRSLWFAHSVMNGVDFWNEGGGDAAKSPVFKGHTVVDGAIDVNGDSLHARDRWLSPDGKLICTSDRTLRFHADADGRYIDYEMTLHALPDQPLVMGDNKDGTLAARVAQWMTLPHTVNAKDAAGKTIKKETGGSGHIVTAKGLRDGAAWGTRADWCDYNAEHNGKTYGIAIFDHPQNLRHPTWWHVRDYGLFGANPFGTHDFEGAKDKTIPAKAGEYTIPAGGSLTLKYRLYFHLGDEVASHVAAHYADYSAGK